MRRKKIYVEALVTNENYDEQLMEVEILGGSTQRIYKSRLKEIPKPVVIPQFVAEAIERGKDCGLTLFGFIDGIEADSDVMSWCAAADEELFRTLTKAWFDGYETEKTPPLYYVLNKKGQVMLRKYENGIGEPQLSSTMTPYTFSNKERIRLTEDEIKDYDKRYWAFAKSVEEWESE